MVAGRGQGRERARSEEGKGGTGEVLAGRATTSAVTTGPTKRASGKRLAAPGKGLGPGGEGDRRGSDLVGSGRAARAASEGGAEAGVTRGSEAQEAARHDSGGKVRLRLAADVESWAEFDGAREEYRYKLHRRWAAGRTVLFVMMNPSTAEVDVDDPTVAKCQRYARRWGFGAMYVANTFGYRVTDQKRLLELEDPVGAGNDRAILEMAAESDLIVLAYGKPHVRLRQRGMDVQAMLWGARHVLHALRLTQDGTPTHPLYLPGDLEPVRMEDGRG